MSRPPGGGDGFGFEPAALRKIHTRLHDGAEDLDRAVTRKAPPVDAGDSSDIVAAAVARLQQIGAAVAQHLDSNADKVDSARGSYAEIENTNEGALQLDKVYPDPDIGPMGKARRDAPGATHDGPLINSPAPESTFSHPRGGRMGKG